MITMKNKVLLVGGGGREDAIARKILSSGAELYSVMKNRNPSIFSVSRKAFIHDELDVDSILKFALESGVDLAFVGPDPVLNTKLVDRLEEEGIRVASPSYEAARLETSKEFMRKFVERNSIPGNIEFKVITEQSEIAGLLEKSGKEYAIKPIGLTGGKGVRVMGVQLHTKEEAVSYAASVIEKDGAVILEERIQGEEFSLQVLSDGTNIAPFPIVQDFKRAYENDEGPNTGGMGAISDSNGGLPFIKQTVAEEALEIIRRIVFHMKDEGNPFKGVIYGQFMQVGDSPKIVEINARFADPEGISVLTLLEDDFVELMNEIVEGKLRASMKFREKASVLKYVVPEGYGSNPTPGDLEISTDPEPDDFRVYYAAVSGTLNNVKMSTSRALALVGLADTIPEASARVEENLWRIRGNYYMRHDIGTEEMLRRKKENVS